MRILVKDENNNVMVLTSVNGFIPPGYTQVPEEELAEQELALARKDKMTEIRTERDRRLLENDKEWLIASKTGQSTATIETEAQTLRDLPEAAEVALAALTTIEDIKNYDAFSGM